MFTIAMQNTLMNETAAPTASGQTSASAQPRASIFASLYRDFRVMLPRAIALLLGLFFLFNFIGNLILPNFAPEFAWLGRDRAVHGIIQIGVAVFMLWAAARPPRAGWRYAATQSLLLLLATILLIEGVLWYRDLLRARFTSAIPIPVAWVSAIFFIIAAHGFRRIRLGQPELSGRQRLAGWAIGVLVAGELFLLGQFWIFGAVAQPRAVDCIVVMGSAVRPDGVPSGSLRDRTIRGIELWEDGWSDHLIFSGGPTPYGISEAGAMMEIARAQGVPEAACIPDEDGWSTWDTALSLRRIMDVRGWKSCIVVTHNYHLSRTRETFRRAGIEVYTVPAERSGFHLKHELFQLGRESAAWIYYYFRPFSDRRLAGTKVQHSTEVRE